MKAEEILFNILKNDKNKRAYVSNKLSDFSRYTKEIINSNLSTKTKKYLIMNMYKQYRKDTYDSTLIGKEFTFMLNSLKARYLKLSSTVEVVL